MRKNLLIIFLVLFLSISKVYAKNDLYEKIDLFGEVLENIKKDYVDEVDQADPAHQKDHKDGCYHSSNFCILFIINTKMRGVVFFNTYF